MNYLELLHTKPNKQLTFKNYFNSQVNVLPLQSMIDEENQFTILSGKSGSGVTHLLNALCHDYIRQGKNGIVISMQSILYIASLLKTEEDVFIFFNHISKQNVIAIDNLQYIFNKSKKQLSFFLQIIQFAHSSHVKIILGCSDLKKDITKSKKIMKDIQFQRIELKDLSSYDVFKALKNLCSMEDEISDGLLYAISGYNGSIKQHVHCLIAIRFNPLFKTMASKNLSISDFDDLFQIKSYFPTQQFRKCFYQMRLPFMQQDMLVNTK
jgi:chromosomal replication initiation ATPase DnaA